MRIEEIISKKDFHFNFSEYCMIEANDNNLFVVMKEKIDPSEEVEFMYYWYDHLTRGSQAVKNIKKSLEDKDWEVFSKYYYDEVPHKCTLPTEIVVYSKKTNKLIGHLTLNKNTFSFINNSEYECG